ncbi:MAG: glycosyltransferase family 4 protein, partial [Clostridia bacterium]|nr:glycosyltransferase family 4 protein [Clostridia bacterium]
GKIGRIINFFSFTLAVMLRLGVIRQYKEVIVYSNPPLLPMAALIANVLFGTQFSFVCYDIYPEIAHATGALSEGGVISRFMRRLNAGIMRRAKNIVVLSGEMKEFLLSHREVEEGKIHIIHNWHTQSYGNALAAEEREEVIAHLRDVTDGKFVVSYFGNMGLCQDIDIILDAAEKLRDREDILFLFAGHGCKVSDIERAVSERGLSHIALLGYLFDSEFEQALAASDCCLVTLEPPVNGMCAPSKLYSYLAAGKPILAAMDARCDMVLELEQYDAGGGVSDAAQLAREILRMRDDEALLRELSDNCTKLYNERHLAQHSMALYAELFAR